MKKSNLKKALLGCVVATAVLSAVPCTAFAAEQAEVVTTNADGSEIQPRADIIGYLYRTYNGQKQRRLYNFTTGEFLSGWENY